ncbi:hypothetical protein HII31_13186 [Pseudocercospora fuligena]|uniref:CFEM domain-containing protein n=1 Tax=Pseudocercospora fuligena TaxID=685502 RepID=A0A8H6VER8_9PEZI|nr:hypothetical protein HII31_13186 [Pseudocercospora fuligena]
MLMYTIATIALFASAVLAQIPGLPDCSQSCITDLGGCNQVDVKCICSNVPLLTKLSCCVSKHVASSAASAATQTAAAAPTNAMQQVLGLGLGAAGLLAVL